MDRKTLLAVALCVLVLIAYPYLLKLFGLDRYLKPSPPPRHAAVDTGAVDSARVRGAARGIPPSRPARVGETSGGGGGTAALSALPLKPLAAELERSYRIETPLYH